MNYKIQQTCNCIRIDIDALHLVNPLADFLNGKDGYFVTQTVVYRKSEKAYILLQKETGFKLNEFDLVKLELNGYVEEFLTQ